MTSAQVVETSVTNNSSFQNYPHLDDHTIQTTDTPGFKSFTMLPVKYQVSFRKNFISSRVIFISTILQRVRKENLAHYFPHDVKLGLLAHSRSFLANQKARNAIVEAENLLKADKPRGILAEHEKNS